MAHNNFISVNQTGRCNLDVAIFIALANVVDVSEITLPGNGLMKFSSF